MKTIFQILLFALLPLFAHAAFTERYVTTTGAGAHDGTTEANAWTFAEMITAAPGAGIRVNMKSNAGYSIGATTLPSGAANAVFIIRGYSATIGDLDNLGRNADGTLNTTGMPAITITGTWVAGTFSFLQNLNITGALSSILIGGTVNDVNGVISCNIVNTQNNASARTYQGDDATYLVNSDFYCSGAAHASVVDCDTGSFVFACRIRGTSTSTLLTINNGLVLNSVFYGNSSSVGIAWQLLVSSSSFTAQIGNTFYGIGTAVTLPNLLNSGIPVALNNSVTDNSEWINSLYSATATQPLIELNNRTRDITTLLTGIETVQAGAVTTDGGGAETDYVDAGAGNFRLISTAPGLSVGLTPYMDIGAYQREPPAAGSARNSVF